MLYHSGRDDLMTFHRVRYFVCTAYISVDHLRAHNQQTVVVANSYDNPSPPAGQSYRCHARPMVRPLVAGCSSKKTGPRSSADRSRSVGSGTVKSGKAVLDEYPELADEDTMRLRVRVDLVLIGFQVKRLISHTVVVFVCLLVSLFVSKQPCREYQGDAVRGCSSTSIGVDVVLQLYGASF